MEVEKVVGGMRLLQFVQAGAVGRYNVRGQWQFQAAFNH